MGDYRYVGLRARETFVACVFLDAFDLDEEHIEVVGGYFVLRMDAGDVELVSFHENLKIF